MTKNKEKQNDKMGDEMQHSAQPSDQHRAVKKLAIASKNDVMIGIEMHELNVGRGLNWL
jgi:hypothetical protein